MGVMERSNYDENNLALKGISASFGAIPVGLSNALCRPDFIHDTTYLRALKTLRGGPLMLTIIKSLILDTESLLHRLVYRLVQIELAKVSLTCSRRNW